MDKKQLEAEERQFNDTSRYNDIMNEPRHVSRAHLPMPQIDRAGQFAPFSALTGYKELLDKTAERYQNKDYLSREELHSLVAQIKDLAAQRPWPTVTVTYFDGESGFYENYTGELVNVDWRRQRLRFRDGKSVVIRNLKRIKQEK
ncbi:MAG: hypothetical protein Q3959_05640 [Limosilactobacillus sp.]|uniref:hypothetical protein n=1 Tax=Limosilactobacillus sp. TaxID=2773925 RepID=UPI0027008E77|nr:hypothetical protein [Limosilactobacillus sp.]